ncbi:prepilin-type N-terminal cleavage/methylation domain-containing protein [Pseudophaeobacter flagellatus]|uniref:prepilin-type N-terminal cleavage/methylation domain-containing protein n=1 Tax=Pseudophaeobacter flagellatus TaxID=2899119 RepID=UPI001E57B43A|nr:prepilin-type N-terminal cleavage/methylation domain-containing protein [Pseudophaeobacter flagellatus]MCD9149788.1 prepilin-type N-terminal cleavage/methylation domain-containing protein [Pseudophaeobacter flagellatus]
MQHFLKRSSRGFTLIELALAILVLALGTLAALRASDQSRLAIGGETPRLLARIAARNRAEELQLYAGAGPALPAEVSQGGQQFLLTTRQEITAGGLIKTEIIARSTQGAGAQLFLYLSPEPRQ